MSSYNEIMDAVKSRDIDTALKLVNEEIKKHQDEPIPDKISLSFEYDAFRKKIEESILGYMMLDEDYAKDVSYFLMPHDFSEARNSVLYNAIINTYKDGDFDLVKLLSVLRKSDNAWCVGGKETLIHIVSSAPRHETPEMVLFVSLLNKRGNR